MGRERGGEGEVWGRDVGDGDVRGGGGVGRGRGKVGG